MNNEWTYTYTWKLIFQPIKLNKELSPRSMLTAIIRLLMQNVILKSIIHTRERWLYQDSDADLIRRFINEFNRDRVFANKHVDDKVLTMKLFWMFLAISFLTKL